MQILKIVKNVRTIIFIMIINVYHHVLQICHLTLLQSIVFLAIKYYIILYVFPNVHKTLTFSKIKKLNYINAKIVNLIQTIVIKNKVFQ